MFSDCFNKCSGNRQSFDDWKFVHGGSKVFPQSKRLVLTLHFYAFLRTCKVQYPLKVL